MFCDLALNLLAYFQTVCYNITCTRFSCYVELDILLVIVKLASNGSNKRWFWTKWSSAFSFSNHDNFLDFPQVPHNLCRNSPLFVSCEKFAFYSYDHDRMIQKAGSNRNWAMASVDGFSPWKEEIKSILFLWPFLKEEYEKSVGILL